MGTIRINVVGLPKGSSLKADQNVVVNYSTREIECAEDQPFTLTYTPPPQPRCILCGAQGPCISDYTAAGKHHGRSPFWACSPEYPTKGSACHDHLDGASFWAMVRAIQDGHIAPHPLSKVRK